MRALLDEVIFQEVQIKVTIFAVLRAAIKCLAVDTGLQLTTNSLSWHLIIILIITLIIIVITR